MQRSLHIIRHKLVYHRVQFGPQYFLTYMFSNYLYKFIIVILSVTLMTQHYWLSYQRKHVISLQEKLILIWMLLFVGGRSGILSSSLLSSVLCISLKRNLQDHPSLVMDSIPIVEVETLSALGFHFDHRLTWAAMIDKMVSCSRQRLGCLCRILDYLDSNTYNLLIRPIMEYGNVAIMGASATQLGRLDVVQNAATSLCQTSFVPLQCCRHAAAVGLLLKLLDCHFRGLLQTFCPNSSTSNLTSWRSSRLAIFTQSYQLADTIVYNSLDILLWGVSLEYGGMKFQYASIRMVILLDGKLYS